MKRFQIEDGSWRELYEQWSAQCHKFDEDFESFAPATFAMLEREIDGCKSLEHSGVYGYAKNGSSYDAVCWLNGAFIPKFDGKVLRVRHLMLAPCYDFEDRSQEDYAQILTDIFEAVLEVSDSEICCPNVKFHFRSPADVALFREFAKILPKSSRFSTVNMAGAWLSITKS